MGSFSAKTIILIMQLSILILMMSSSVLADGVEHVSWPAHPPAEAPKHHKGHYHHHHHPPTHPPVHPPTPPPAYPPLKPPVHPPVEPPVYPPVKPPTKPPVYPPHVKPPVHPPFPVRKFVAIQGVVYCKSCKFVGINTLWKATPLVGALVRVKCYNTKYRPVVAVGKTDKNGYFLILLENVTSAASHKCKVFLAQSPTKTCDVATNYNYGRTGASLVPYPINRPNPLGPKYALYNVGPLAYEPSKKIRCPR